MSARAARVVAVAIIVLISALPQTQARAKGVDTDPPSGIVPTTATLQQVLAAHKKAIGKPIDPSACLIEEDAIAENGLTGTTREVSCQGDYRSTTTLGPFITSEGSISGQPWSEDENGQVVPVQGVHRRGAADARALNDALTHPTDGVKLLGEVSSPVTAYVVEVNPPDGRREWLFFDKVTSLTDRIEAVISGARTVETYADFKTVNGRTEAWSGHYSDGEAANDVDWHIGSLQVAKKSDQTPLAAPTSKPFVDFPNGVTSTKLPATIVGSRIVITLTIGGKGYDFLLDSGSSDINVDYAAAQQMGLTLYGKGVGAASGTFTASRSVIGEADIGPLALHNVVIDVIPFMDYPTLYKKVVGLVGYDFIAGAVLRVDYVNNAVYAYERGQYSPAAGSYPIPVMLDDRVPTVSAQVGQAAGDHFIIDTGADIGYLFPAFASAHPKDVADEGLGGEMGYYYTMSARGVGGTVPLIPTQVSRFQIGGVSFTNWLMYTLDAKNIGGEDYDGLVGYDFLRFFNVVFDYADSVIYLEPNDTFRRSTKH